MLFYEPLVFVTADAEVSPEMNGNDSSGRIYYVINVIMAAKGFEW